MPIKVDDFAGLIEDDPVAMGIQWAVDHKARIINVSLMTTHDTPEVRSAVSYAYAHGVVVVAGTGNFGSSLPTYPASYPHVLAVGGSTNRDRWWPGSDYGEKDLVLAPAVNIWSTGAAGNHHTYGRWTGTSFAAAHVSGLVALLLSVRPDLTVDQVIAAIEQGADPVKGQQGYNSRDGWGRINCYRSLVLARAIPHVASPPVDNPSR